MSDAKVAAIERQIGELTSELNALRKENAPTPVPNYAFETASGATTLRDLFGEQEKLLAIHNMGQGCRYCTLWADGFNGLLPHLESAMAVVLVSKDAPETQRRFANSRGWRFRLASHGGGAYIQEQGVFGEAENYPGAVVYERDGDAILAQEHLRVRPRRPLLRPVAVPRHGRHGRWRLVSAVRLLAKAGDSGRRRHWLGGLTPRKAAWVPRVATPFALEPSSLPCTEFAEQTRTRPAGRA